MIVKLEYEHNRRFIWALSHNMSLAIWKFKLHRDYTDCPPYANLLIISKLDYSDLDTDYL